MALKKSFARRPSPQPRRDHVPPLPHPSWRLNAAGPRPAIVCAGSALVLDPGVCVDIVATRQSAGA